MEFKTLLLHWEWKGIVLLTLAACFLLFMRGLSARRRHRFLFLTILSLLLIPAAHHWLSSVSFKRFQLIQPSVWGKLDGTFQIGSDNLRLAPAIDQAGEGDGSVTTMDPGVTDGDTGFSNADGGFRTYDLRWDIMWGIGFILLMIRFCWQQWLLARLVRVSPEINDARLKGLLDQCVLDVGLNSTPTMIESSFLRVPATWGWFRPVICLPAGTSSWSSEVLITVLQHECSHIKRRDYASLHLA